MEDIASMFVMQGRVFAPDIVPYRLIITPLGTNFIKQAFSFRDASWNQENWDYVFQDGTFDHDGTVVPITWLGFNDRRVVVQVQGDSDTANAAYDSVVTVLAGLAPGFQDATPLLFTEETSCSARLDFEWTELFNPKLVDHVLRATKGFSSEEAELAVRGVTIRFTLGVIKKAERLNEYGITLFDQTIAVEPKAGVPLSERMYYTYSPCDSKSHLKLVSELEASLSKERTAPIQASKRKTASK